IQRSVIPNYTYSAGLPTPDFMFTARGTITGAMSGLGPIYLFLRDIRDVTNGLDPSSPNLQGDQMILAIFPQTGHCATYQVDPTDAYNNVNGSAGADTFADDPFRFAKGGQAAGG